MIYTESPESDMINVLTYIDQLSESLGMSEVQVDVKALMKACVGMREEFPHIDGKEKASVFKKAGNFLAYFLAYKPIRSSFPSDLVKGLNDFDPNAFIGFEIAVACLENSVIKLSNGTQNKVCHPIYLSDHSYADIICALSTDKNISPESHFHIYSVFLEQLTYKTNPHCQYTNEGKENASQYYTGEPFDPTQGDDLAGA